MSLRKEKLSLCKGPVPCPTSMPFVQEGICCNCLGKFYASSAYCRELCERGRRGGGKEILVSFRVLQNKGKQKGGVVFFQGVLLTSWKPRANLSLAGIPIHWHAGSLNGEVLSRRRNHGDFLPGGRGLLAFRECIAAWAVQGMRCDIG